MPQLSAQYIQTGTIDTIQDHCHGDHEALLSASVSFDPDREIAIGEVTDGLIECLQYSVSQDCGATGRDILRTLEEEVRRIAEGSLCDITSDDEETEMMVWVRLTWYDANAF